MDDKLAGAVVIDVGTIARRDRTFAQAERASLWDLTMALHEGTEFVDGQVRDNNLATR
jgi:isoquinoline 1-oxidoreductase beta subunit